MNKEAIVSPNFINPVDYFNNNFVQYTFDFLLTLNNVKQTGISSLTYVKNKTDETKKMIVIENHKFIAKIENGLGLETDKEYTPFMLLQKFKFKDKFMPAMYFVIQEIMNNQHNYIRVNIKYFKITEKQDYNNILRKTLKLWDKQTLVDDYGPRIIDKIEKYDDFTIEPNNKKFEQVVNNNYNLYREFSHTPTKKNNVSELDFYWINTLLEHIFGNQYELGLKYMKILYEHPKQKLPILVLASIERSTGKTTFIDFCDMLFGDNSVVINPENISNQFNAPYSDKNIIMIEESKFENMQAIEKIKNLATQKKMLVNAKFVQPYSISFYGKLIITSNDENKFSRVDGNEIRYWVRKIPSLKDKSNHSILTDMKSEIPYFLKFLEEMPDVDMSKSRMVFTPEDLKTDALQKVKAESLPSLHKNLNFLLDDHSANNTEIEEFEFIGKDIKKAFYYHDSKIDIDYITRILKDSMELERRNMKRYIPLESSQNNNLKKSGRPFVFKNPYYEFKQKQ